MIAQEITDEYINLHANIDKLLQSATQYNNEDTVALMKIIVPEFISMNSSYERLDKVATV